MHGGLAKLKSLLRPRRSKRSYTAPGSTFQVGPRSLQHGNPHLAQANRLLEMEEYDAAEAILRRLVAEDPAEAEYLSSLAICLGRG